MASTTRRWSYSRWRSGNLALLDENAKCSAARCKAASRSTGGAATLTVRVPNRPVVGARRCSANGYGYLRGGAKIWANTSATRLPPSGARFVDGEVKATTVPPRAIDGSILR